MTLSAARMAQREEAQRRHEDRYYAMVEKDRPRPTHEIWELRDLARKAKDDPSAALDFAVVCTPQTFLMALAAERWDETHVLYDCIHCHDGKDLPHSGYVCQVCGAEGSG